MTVVHSKCRNAYCTSWWSRVGYEGDTV